MKYEKPNFQTLNLALDKAMATSGLGNWLDSQGFDASAENNITTYEVNS